jgi:hypothetical protein
MIKIYSMIGALALFAGAITMAPGLVSASSRYDLSTQTTTSGKGDRLDIASRLSCKQQSWPYVDRSCVADHRTESGTAKKVRVVTTDRNK